MKKIRILFLMLLSCSALFVSCNKEQIDSDNLEGTWRAYKGELLFDGSVVLGGADALDGFVSLTFSNGILTTSIDGYCGSAAYSYANGVITAATILPVQLTVIELTKTNLVIDLPRGIISFGSGDWGEAIATYKGRKIYRSEGYLMDEYWYTSGSKMVYCEPLNEEDFSEGWTDTTRLYLKQ